MSLTKSVQQGNPLGTPLFCLAIHDIIVSLKSQFKTFYLNDATLGGPVDDVKSDVAASEMNLFPNHDKSEIICVDKPSKLNMLSFSSSLRMVGPTKATLGSPIGGDESLNIVRESKVEQLQTLDSCLKQLLVHNALCLLWNALAIPKVLCILRMAPSFRSPILTSFDCVP